MKTETEKLNKRIDETTSDLQSLRGAIGIYEEAIGSANKRIEEHKKEFDRLANSIKEYRQNIREANREANSSISEAIVGKERDLREELLDLQQKQGQEGKELSDKENQRLNEIQNEINDLSLAYQKYGNLQEEIREANRRADLTDFQRELEDIETRRNETINSQKQEIELIQIKQAAIQEALDKEKELIERNAKQSKILQEKEKERLEELNDLERERNEIVEGRNIRSLRNIGSRISTGIEALQVGARIFR